LKDLRSMLQFVGDNAKRVGAELVGTHFALVGESEFAPVVKKIRDSNADVVLSMLVGDSTVSFFRALADAGILPRVLPVVSLSLGENELGQMGELAAAGNYVARTRFPWSDATGGDGFGTRFKKKYGAHRPISESMESAYLGVHLWAAAVEKAGTDETEKVRQALKSQELVVMGAKVRIDASNQHAWKVFQMGKITNDNTIENVKTETEALPPIPFPPPRTRGEWEQFSRALYETWDHNWANPHKPASLGGKPIKEKKRHKKK
jgi:urea transport system substrate-binding protein